MKIAKRHTKTNQHNRRCLSAKGLSLYPLALRPRLFLSKIVATAAIFPLKMPGFSKNSRKVVVLSTILGIFSIFGTFFVAGNPVSAASLTLSVPSNLSLDISPSSSGTFVKSNPGQISVSTDNVSGYTLVIKAKNSENGEDGNALLNGTNKLLSISSNLTEDQYKGSGNLNTWGYLPSKLNGAINNSFLPGPTNEETVIEKTENANNESANGYDLTLAAKVDSSLAAGSYANTFVLSASVNAIPYLPMQNWQGCDSLGDDEIITLRDERDDSLYRVAKLADGKCWMIDNLKIVGKEISSEDSDMASGNFTIPPSAQSGFSGNDNNVAYYGKTKDTGGDDYGAQYSWYTATAGTSTSSMSSGDATNSICPKGWRLPKGGANGDFQKLYDSGYNNISRITAKPIPGFTYAGSMDGGSLYGQDSNGYYWSSTVKDSSYAYRFYFDENGNVYSQNNINKWYGYSVRCIARDPAPSPELLTQQWTADADDINVSVGKGIEMIMIADGSDNWKPYYAFPGKDVNLSGTNGKKYIISVVPEANKVMTNLTKENGKISATGGDGSYESMQDLTECTEAGTNVTDARNGVSYTIAKIGNKCWMLSNLRLAAGTVLTSADSNVTSNFTLPTEAWTSSSQNYYSKKIMKECHGTAGNDSSNTTCNNTATGVTEYYYNWYAAKANPSTSGSYGSTQDAMSLGSICPKNWSLPDYNSDVTAANAWNDGANPGMLATVGFFSSGSQYRVGTYAFWWSTPRLSNNDDYAFGLFFGSTGTYRNVDTKDAGSSVRCMLQEKTMQTVNDWKSEVKAGDIVTAKDERDGSTYRVTRLDDGKLWMIDNLKIMNTTIHNTDSDISASSWTIPVSSENGFGDYDKNEAYYDGVKDGDIDYGALYSWYAATAGTGTQAMSTSGQEASSSICPKGWRLPKGGPNGDFVALDKAMGGNGTNRNDSTGRDRFLKKPIPGFTYAGYMFNGSLRDQGSNGYYWSSTVYNDYYAYGLGFYSDGSIDPQHNYGKYLGFSVRCIARE